MTISFPYPCVIPQCLSFPFTGKMAQMEQQLPIPMPDLSTLRITTAVSMLGKAYGCGQCNGEFILFKQLEIRNIRNIIAQKVTFVCVCLSFSTFLITYKNKNLDD